MCNAFGMAADERSSVATECELARKAVFLSPFAPPIVLVNSSEIQRSFLSRTMELARRAAEASNCWIAISA
jgi:hypothetical protein